MTPLRATLRLQFHRGFDFAAARGLVPYFAALGISHVYASPVLAARPGSLHGYDVVDHARINPELGGEAGFRGLAAALREAGLGIILDIVPNHMAVGADNAWWLDVLEWGRDSPFAGHFDIAWDPPDGAPRGKLLAPFLGAPYGQVLGAGELGLVFDPTLGRIAVAYHDHRFPIAAADGAAICAAAGGVFADAAARLRAARTHAAATTARSEIAELAATGEGARALDAALAPYAPQDAAGRARLHALLERQHYRLAWWRVAADEINWRRFFDVNGLAALAIERDEVFEAVHAVPLRLHREGLIDGLRIDHVDGLTAPGLYCRRLRARLDAQGRGPALILVEKILAPGERVPADWPVDGSTGYDAMDQIGAVLHDPRGEAPLTAFWTSRTGRPACYRTEAIAARAQILRDSLAAESRAAAEALHRLARAELATRDIALAPLQRAMEAVLRHFRAYRLYAGRHGASAADRRVLDAALAAARRELPRRDHALLAPLRRWLIGEGGAEPPAALEARRRFQQLSAPLAAKAEEDTAFYRYGRLLSRNEVGSDPGEFALAPRRFHAACLRRARRLPRGLVATATHDHKRGEDCRARLAVLSELPEAWSAALDLWMARNAALRTEVDGNPAPDAADEIMLYQTLIAAWPLDPEASDGAGTAAFRERVAGWLEKALREAKRHSEWALPDAAYEAACAAFLARLLERAESREALASFAAEIAPAAAAKGLAQALLRCALPGIPDLYQGTEFWDLSLVDPDNRRPVDFAARAAALAAGLPPAALLPAWRDGRVKQAVIARALDLRRRRPRAFAGAYLPLHPRGPRAEHVLAFARAAGDEAVIALVTRLPAGLVDTDAPRIAPSSWQDTVLPLPPPLAGRRWRDALREGAPPAGGGTLALGLLLEELPVALLEAV